jgi:NAD(P)-dependent dehydrogenase (short-subunit alcohol dehydrogenase family)
MAENNGFFSHMFHHSGPQQSSAPATATPGSLTADNTVSEWLNHPVGGAVLREMLQQAGQSEKALRPVRGLSMKRLISLSQGKFTQQMLDDMVAKVQAGQMPASAAAPAETETPAASQPEAAPLPEWHEKITPDRFAGKTIIVTGAGSGIGRATASRVAREGGRVIAVDISQERLNEFKTSLPDADITLVASDITNDDAIQQIVSAAGEHIDGLANVAGIMDNMTPLHEVSDDIWNKVMAVNVTGMMKLSRAVIPAMLQQHSGSIVNIASEAAFRGSAAGVAYTTSKHAVVGLTKSAAYMYAPSGIRINAVAPGPVLTNIQARFDSKLGEERVNDALATSPQAVDPEVLAASITFMLSDDAVNLNGAILPSDDGWSVQ